MINIDDVINYYQNLLIVQYNQKEKAKAEIGLFTEQLLNNDIYSQVAEGFDLDTAVGNQLDILGKLIGVNRFYQETGEVLSRLSDDDYRLILRLRIVQNNSDHSEKSIDDGLFLFFTDKIVMSASDNMTMVYFVKSDSERIALIAFSKGVLPRPMGVNLNGLIVRDNSFFGLITYNTNIVSTNITGFTDYTEGFDKEGEILTYDKVIQL